MKKSVFYLFFAAISVLFFSCNRETSDSVNQDKIYTEYELFYEANQDVTYARATFKFSNIIGTKLELSDPSNVTFNGEQLAWQDALAYYELRMQGKVRSGTFVWEDTEGNSYSNQISIREIDFPNQFGPIAKGSSYEFIWQGDSLKEGETVTLTMNADYEGDGRIVTENDLNAISLIIPQNYLDQMATGTVDCWIERFYKITPPLDATSAGGFIQGRYRAANQTFNLTD